MRFRAYIAAAVLAVASTHAGAQAVGYTEAATGAQTQGVLYRVNLSAKTAAAVGQAGSYGGQPLTIVGLTISPSGTLYGVSVTSPPYLVTVSKSNGAATVVGALSGLPQSDASLAALAFTCDGSLWLTSAHSNNFWQVDASSGTTTLIGNFGSIVTGMAASGNTLYAAGGAGSNTSLNNWYTVDTATAGLSIIGSYGSGGWIGIVSPGFDGSGQVWALIDTLPINGTTPVQWNKVAQINSATGALSQLGDITQPPTLAFIPMRGLAIAPPVCSKSPATPSPFAAPALSLLGMGLMILGLMIVSALYLAVTSRSK